MAGIFIRVVLGEMVLIACSGMRESDLSNGLLVWSVMGGVFGFGFFGNEDRGETGDAEGSGEFRFPASD